MAMRMSGDAEADAQLFIGEDFVAPEVRLGTQVYKGPRSTLGRVGFDWLGVRDSSRLVRVIWKSVLLPLPAPHRP